MVTTIDTLPPLDKILDARFVDPVRTALAVLEPHASLLRPRDRFILAALIGLPIVEADLLTPGSKPTISEHRTALEFVLTIAACCDPRLGLEAGMLCRLAFSRSDWAEVMTSRLQEWMSEYDSLPPPHDTARFAELTPREQLISKVRDRLIDARIASGQELLAALRAATRSAARRSGVKLKSEDTSDEALAANFHLSISKTKDILELIFVGDERTLRLGAWDVRDALTQPRRLYCASLDVPFGDEGKLSLATTVADKAVEEEASQREAHELSVALEREIAAHRSRRMDCVGEDSPAALILENLAALLMGERDLRSLAEFSGHPYQTLWAAWKKELAELRQNPRIRRFGVEITQGG